MLNNIIIKFRLVVVLPFILAFQLGSAQVGRVAGRVVDRSTQKPLANVSVTITGVKGTQTDTLGFFRLVDLPTRSYNIDFSLIGFKTQTLNNVVVNTGNENNFTIELEPASATLQEVVVKANRRTATAATIETPFSVQRLTTEEIKSNPGGNFDISKVIQSLPGVGGGQGGGGFRNDIIIRGGAPNENVFYLDGVEIPVINHFQTQGSSGGPQGILNVSFIDEVKLSSSAFEARYDNVLSSVLQFRQKNGNRDRVQGNVRLSASELAATFDGPLSKSKNTTFLASVRRSYLQLLFSLIDLPIRPNYWDFQTKITTQINPKTSLSFIGLGAIDEFSFAPIKSATPEKLYVLNSNPLINQWNYTAGLTLKRLLDSGFVTLTLSRNTFHNNIEQYEDNQAKIASQQTLDYQSTETENKLRLDVNKVNKGWKFAYGVSVQVPEYDNNTFSVVRKEIRDSNSAIIQPAVTYNYISPLNSFVKFGAFAQLSKKVFDQRLGISAGVRTDMNTFTTQGMNGLRTLSPRVSFSYLLAEKWTLNASVGRYYKIPPYTILGFADNTNKLVNKNTDYLRSDHYTAGVEFLPNRGLRFTGEIFLKRYTNVAVSKMNGISLSNLGSDFQVLGNEAVETNGTGRAYGFEFFVQKKLSEKFFALLSYTFYRSEYTGRSGEYVPSSWDNRHLLSATAGYKLGRNWEAGVKFRYQGGAPYTPYDLSASQLNYLSRGQGILNYAQLNTLRLQGFNSADIRIDKKWNLRRISVDAFIDVTNFYAARNTQAPNFTFQRNSTNTAFVTSDGKPIKPDGSNAMPVLLKNEDASLTPTIGLIVEF
jgi:CarboxypepD_reg-like domain/TonB-dependent Receptor Plug Domain